MRLEIDSNKNLVETSVGGTKDDELQQSYVSRQEDSLGDKQRRKEQFKELDLKGKIGYIWDYYKWFFIVGVAVIIALVVFIRDYADNSKPTYLNAVILNSHFAIDTTNTLEEDYIEQFKINTDENHLYFDTSINLNTEIFDTTMVASQMRLVSMYSAGEIDVVMGPVDIMEGPADCNCYADLSEILPQELMDELADRDYEFYYYDEEAVAKKRAENSEFAAEPQGEYAKPYIAGVYLDNCSYLNNNGEYGCYDAAETPGARPIFTIAANAPNVEHAIEFLQFLVQNH